MKPLWKYVGGKRESAPAVLEALAFPSNFTERGGVYIEPFVGSGAVFLALREHGPAPARQCEALLCDMNLRVIQTYLAVQHAPLAVVEGMGTLDWTESWKTSYYDARAAFNMLPSQCLTLDVALLRAGAGSPLVTFREVVDLYVPAASLFLWLNKTCYNGMFRVKLNAGGDPTIPIGGMNVPVGKYKRPARPETSEVFAMSHALAKTTVWYGDFSQGIQFAKEGDRVYCDPPYVPVSETSDFTSYSTAFEMRDQIRLRDAAVAAARRGARVVLSNHDLPIVREEVYPTSMGFEHLATLKVRRSINSKADKRQAVDEILVAIGDPS